MEVDEQDFIKRREIVFTELHPDPNQAGTAADLLKDVNGIRSATAKSPTVLEVEYHVLSVSLEHIENALIRCGFHLCSKLIYKIARALYYYTEENQRELNGCGGEDHNSTRKIFINRYQQREHGCADHRPEHWRKYL